MSLVPEEELKRQGSFNLAPMVDFLFLVVAIFAVLAVTRTVLYDSELELVRTEQPLDKEKTALSKDCYYVDLGVTRDGKYKWLTESQDYLIADPALIKSELRKQQMNGLLPRDNEQTKVLLHIDKGAEWGAVASLILAVREAGFTIHPLYEQENAETGKLSVSKGTSL